MAQSAIMEVPTCRDKTPTVHHRDTTAPVHAHHLLRSRSSAVMRLPTRSLSSTMPFQQELYLTLARRLSANPLASSGLILLCSLPSLLLARFHTQRYPFWLSALLIALPALEFPLIFVLHPASLASPATTPASPPSVAQLALQTAVFFLIEALSRAILLPSVVAVVARLEHEQGDPGVENGMTTAIIMDFSTSRIALVVGMAVIGIPSRLTRLLGKLHPLSMTGWMIVHQNLATLVCCRVTA